MFFFIYLFMLININFTVNEKIPIKIVDDPVNYEHGNLETSMDVAATDDNDWLNTVHPANFSGPEQLHQLEGWCFSWNNFKYRYEFCPFQNMTQHEISATWNPYKGVLGVWGEWLIQGNLFSEMLLLQGDTCEGGVGNRSVEVRLRCDETVLGRISEVTEPDRCRYLLTFSSQLVCHPHALLVYPRLSQPQQQAWDQLFTEHTHGLISDKVLEIGLQQIFRGAGLLLSEEVRNQLRSAPLIRPPRPLHPSVLAATPCEMQLEQLRLEIESLREELARLAAGTE